MSIGKNRSRHRNKICTRGHRPNPPRFDGFPQFLIGFGFSSISQHAYGMGNNDVVCTWLCCFDNLDYELI